MTSLEEIMDRLTPRPAEEKAGLTVNNSRRKIGTLDPQGRKVRIEQFLFDANAVTTKMTVELEIQLPNGTTKPLAGYTTDILVDTVGDAIDGAPLITEYPIDVYLTNADNENVAWWSSLTWIPMDDSPPSSLW